MSVIISNLSSPLGSKLVTDSDVDSTIQANITGSSGTIYAIELDNTNNSTAVYFKLWNATSPTIGVTAPNLKYKIEGNERKAIQFPNGLAMSTGISYACVTESAASGTTAPTLTVSATMLIG